MYRFPFLKYSLQHLYSYRGAGDNISLVVKLWHYIPVAQWKTNTWCLMGVVVKKLKFQGNSTLFALFFYWWWTAWSAQVVWTDEKGHFSSPLFWQRHRCIWICHKATWKMSITDKLSNSFLINHHQPHSGRNLITLFSLNYHQSLCQRWFIFQEGPLLTPQDIVFTSQFLPKWDIAYLRAVLSPTSPFYTAVITCFSIWLLVDSKITWKLVANGGGDLSWTDQTAASNQILETYSTPLTGVLSRCCALITMVFVECHC